MDVDISWDLKLEIKLSSRDLVSIVGVSDASYSKPVRNSSQIIRRTEESHTT